MSFTWLLLKSLKVISQGFSYFRHCSIFKIPLCFLDFACFLSKALIYYITFSFVCQPLFRSFFKSFLWFLVVSREATYSVYHISFRLSTPFQKFFSKVFFVVYLFLFQSSLTSLLRFFAFPKAFTFHSLSGPSSLSLAGQLYYFITFWLICQVLLPFSTLYTLFVLLWWCFCLFLSKTAFFTIIIYFMLLCIILWLNAKNTSSKSKEVKPCIQNPMDSLKFVQ